MKKLVGIIVLLAVSGCAEQRQQSITTIQMPKLAVSTDVTWTGAAASDDFPIAKVGDSVIPASRLQRAIAGGLDPDVALEQLIDHELAAQAAIKLGEEDGEASRLFWEQALVLSLLDDKFQTGFTQADVPFGDFEYLYSQRQVRSKFVHHRMFEVKDYQWNCCNGRPADCNTPESIACFEEGQKAMGRVWQALTAEQPDHEDLFFLVEKYQAMAPRLAFQEFSFSYDEERQMQRGTILFDDAVVNSVINGKVRTFLAPVLSAFGWHVMYIVSSTPAKNLPLSDPTVQKELYEHFHPWFQQVRFFEFLATLAGTEQLLLLKGYFEGSPKKFDRPKYDVEVFIDSIGEAVERAGAVEDDPA
ncbi:MAG TPA: hypothetical protein PLJ74_10905 [Myxococcota bacterium]|nr:hypothetical protein [Myxococcota bacterium]